MKREDKIKADIARLQNELEQLDKSKSDAPKPLENIDYERIKANVVAHVQDLATNNYVSEDDHHYIFEVALEAVYGKDIWKWYNKTNKG